MGRLLIELSDALVRASRPPALATSLKSGEQTAEMFRLRVPDAVPDLEVTIAAEYARGDSTHCALSVEVVAPSRGGWPNLAGSEVVLKRRNEVLATQVTDAFG